MEGWGHVHTGGSPGLPEAALEPMGLMGQLEADKNPRPGRARAQRRAEWLGQSLRQPENSSRWAEDDSPPTAEKEVRGESYARRSATPSHPEQIPRGRGKRDTGERPLGLRADEDWWRGRLEPEEGVLKGKEGEAEEEGSGVLSHAAGR